MDALIIDRCGIYIDATFGRGGHSAEILARLNSQGKLIAIDRDQAAIDYANENINDIRFKAVHSNYSEIREISNTLNVTGKIDGILVDCGVSSPQLDDASRGFSFAKDAPLDMRMDQTQNLTAELWINEASESEIADTIYNNADERYSRKIAKAICIERAKKRIKSTLELAEIVKQSIRHSGPTHPATRTFQAIRVHINAEYSSLTKMLEGAVDVLKVGGRLVMISFHSTEHLIVKRFIQLNRPGNENLKRGLQTPTVPRLKRIGRVVRPSLVEMRQNTRSRSAQMRIVEKIA